MLPKASDFFHPFLISSQALSRTYRPHPTALSTCICAPSPTKPRTSHLYICAPSTNQRITPPTASHLNLNLSTPFPLTPPHQLPTATHLHTHPPLLWRFRGKGVNSRREWVRGCAAMGWRLRGKGSTTGVNGGSGGVFYRRRDGALSVSGWGFIGVGTGLFGASVGVFAVPSRVALSRAACVALCGDAPFRAVPARAL